MKTNILRLGWKDIALFFCILLLLSLFFMDSSLFTDETKIEKDTFISTKDEKLIKQMVIQFVEESDVYIITAKDAADLRSRVEEFCTEPLATKIYNSSLKYLGVSTGFSIHKVKSIRLSRKAAELKAFVEYTELVEGAESEDQGKAIFNLKSTKRGWRIYKQRYN